MFQRLNAHTALVPVPASVPNSDLPSSLLPVPPTLTSPSLVSEGATSSVSEGATLPSSPAPKEVINNNVPSSSPSQNLRRSNYVCRAPTILDLFTPIASVYKQMFQHTPSPSGCRQIRFAGNDRSQRVSNESLNQQFLANRNWDQLLNLCNSSYSSIGAFIAEHNQNCSYKHLIEYLNPALFITMANKEDNPTYAEAMQGPDAAGFIEAM